MPTMLPSAPKTLGRLSDVFISALGAVTGKNNRLGLKKANQVCVVLVDGLGSENLRSGAGHAPFLNAALKNSKSLNTVFPTTTAAAITSFGVGSTPSRHGIFGYSVYERSTGLVRNLLSGWGESFKPVDFQRLQTVATAAHEAGVKAYAIGPHEYSSSGFTELNMQGVEYLGAKSFDERVATARKVLASKHKSISYLYFPELDATAHAFGVESQQWLAKLEDLDSAMRQLVSELGQHAAVILTADHGVIDVDEPNQIMLDEIDLPGLVAVTGDPRNCFLYFEPKSDLSKLRADLSQQLDKRVIVASPGDLQQGGWLESSIENSEYLPDLFLISIDKFACYHRGFAKPQSLKMVGQHGSISTTELSVPFLKFGALAD